MSTRAFAAYARMNKICYDRLMLLSHAQCNGKDSKAQTALQSVTKRGYQLGTYENTDVATVLYSE